MKRKRSFTLLEVLIVLVLVTAVLLLVSAAADIYLRQMTINRTRVEDTQLARTLLNMIAADLRNVIVQLRKETPELNAPALAEIAGLSGIEAEIMEMDTDSPYEQEETIIYGQRPGIYGDMNWIQIDTAKLPRGELSGSHQVTNPGTQLRDRLSPSKTVLYYLPETRDNSQKNGLVRRQLDRQVVQYAIDGGLEQEYEQYDESFAPEVVNIEFAYYYYTQSDSEESASTVSSEGQWTDYWDMDDREKLPEAVQITLTLRRQSFGNSLLSFAQTNETETVIFSLIVPLTKSSEQ